MTTSGGERIRITVCSHFRKELDAILENEEFQDAYADDYSFACTHPFNAIAEAQSELLSRLDECPSVLFLGGCFLTNVKPILSDGRKRVVRLGRCFDLVAGPTLIERLLNEGAYLMLPSWLENWPDKIESWGLDRETARSVFGESMRKIVLLDTGIAGDHGDRLAEFGEYLGLPVETIPVGLDYMRLAVGREVSTIRHAEAMTDLSAAREEANRYEADSLMILDLLEALGLKKSEREIVDGLFDLLGMFFAASSVLYLPLEGDPESAIARVGEDGPGAETRDAVARELGDWLKASSRQSEFIEGNRPAFYIRLQRGTTVFGGLRVSGFLFPKYAKRYLSRAKVICRLCAMILENLRLMDRVEALANTDSLTGIANRRHFFERAEHESNRARRHGNALSAMMIDIDFFKKVNDTWGHDAGDRVIKAVVRSLVAGLRSTDVLGRVGGEEFAAILPDTDIDQAFALAERLRAAVRDTEVDLGISGIFVTISAGVAQVTFDDLASENAIERVIGRCDNALYQAKRNGRDRCERSVP